MIRIAVASGKGGTGKTTVATSLAWTLADQGVRLLDCDVEAPDAALFLKPALREHAQVGIPIPFVDKGKCTFCGTCAQVCQFHALAVVGKRALVFPELCHGCGSCTLACPEGAISEQLRPIGRLDRGPAEAGIAFQQGKLDIGEPMAVPVIRRLKQWTPATQPVEIRDAPPGASCPVVETVRGAHFALLVTEPTPFGLHDLKQVYGMVRDMRIPAGVVINRDGIGDQGIDRYCAVTGLPVLMRIPMERRYAETLARGGLLAQEYPELRDAFRELFGAIRAAVAA